MVRPNEHHLVALARLERDQDFQVFMQWLVVSLADARNTLEEETGEHRIFHHQGYVVALKDIVTAVAEARDALSKTGRAA